MLKLALYGKGGIGKSTIAANLSYALALQGHKVLQIGCDPKADSTLALHPNVELTPVLSLLLKRRPRLEEAIYQGVQGVYCVETGGPTPGLGCAGRAIEMVFEYLQQEQALEKLQIDCVIYDVLGDVVCGGFATPMRKGHATSVAIVSSTEKMSIYAAKNIKTAIQNFATRGYAKLIGVICNERSQTTDQEDLHTLQAALDTDILAHFTYSQEIKQAEKLGKTVMELYAKAPITAAYTALATSLYHNFATS